jgi:GTP:adenosylcobinamide-phosphate guanylyltransferase
MSKPSDIPQDVWDTSDLLNKIANEIFTGSVDEVVAFVDRHVEAIARAIMAEREACAKLSADFAIRVMPKDSRSYVFDLAAAIRNRGAA